MLKSVFILLLILLSADAIPQPGPNNLGGWGWPNPWWGQNWWKPWSQKGQQKGPQKNHVSPPKLGAKGSKSSVITSDSLVKNATVSAESTTKKKKKKEKKKASQSSSADESQPSTKLSSAEPEASTSDLPAKNETISDSTTKTKGKKNASQSSSADESQPSTKLSSAEPEVSTSKAEKNTTISARAAAAVVTPATNEDQISITDSIGTGSWTTGPATHYNPGDFGSKDSCGNDVGADSDNVAISGQVMNNGMCGKMVEVKYNGNTIQVEATNTCPECPAEHIDLSEAAFRRMNGGSLEPGKPTVEWRWV